MASDPQIKYETGLQGKPYWDDEIGITWVNSTLRAPRQSDVQGPRQWITITIIHNQNFYLFTTTRNKTSDTFNFDY